MILPQVIPIPNFTDDDPEWKWMPEWQDYTLWTGILPEDAEHWICEANNEDGTACRRPCIVYTFNDDATIAQCQHHLDWFDRPDGEFPKPGFKPDEILIRTSLQVLRGEWG